jgi:ribose/xylose/arabinose/galactoside ABC-type transport system permease subunit
MSSDSNPTAEPVLPRDATSRRRFTRVSTLIRRDWVWMVLLAVMAFLATTSSNFLTSTNLLNILRQVSIVGIVAIGVVVVLITGNLDL